MRDCAGPYQRAGVLFTVSLPFVLKAEIAAHTCNGTTIYSRSTAMAAADRQRSGNARKQPREPLRNRRLCLPQTAWQPDKGKEAAFRFYTGGREPPFGNCSYLPRVLALALSGCTRPSGLGSGLANCAIFLDPWHESVIHAALCQTFLHPPPFLIRKLPIATWSPMGSCIATLSKRLRWKSCSRSGTRS